MLLSDNQLSTVKSILRDYLPNARMLAFGSRIRGNAYRYSDLDIAMIDTGKIDLGTLSAIDEAFSESDLPFKVDMIDWHRISSEFQQVILQSCEEL